jgi:Reverse transcriptase (RNA-dependent DNA polymerase)
VLFIIFINDLPELCKELSDIYLFADDAKLYRIIRNNTDYLYLQQSCQTLFNWAEEWCMSLNVDKCKVLTVVRNKTQGVKYDYNI